jgi:Peptidase family C25
MKKIMAFLTIGILILSGIGASAFSIKKITTRSISTDKYDMVIITPEEFVSDLQPLVDHKNTHGIQTTIKTTEAIYTEYKGRDNAEQIKHFIQDALENWNIKYVLLVGGKKGQSFDWYVPVRYSNIKDGTDYDFFISDLYYADIYKYNKTSDKYEFDDWDSNGNDIFGEWKGAKKDIIDLKPDVIVGRLPCRNHNDVKTIVEKIIAYESTPADPSWYKRMICIGGDTFPGNSGLFMYEGEATCDIAASYMTGFNIIKLYTSTGALTGSAEVLNEMNQGCGFVLTRGRGGTDKVRTYLPDGTEIVPMSNKDIRSLSNKDKYPIFVFGECNHAKLDVCLLNFLKLFKDEPNIYQNFTHNDCIMECIAWRMASKQDGGSIATITNTNFCYGAGTGDANSNGIPDDAETYGGWLALEIFRLIGQEGMKTLGEIHTQSILNYIDTFPVYTNLIHSKSIEEWILIGDPSLKIGGYQ